MFQCMGRYLPFGCIIVSAPFIKQEYPFFIEFPSKPCQKSLVSVRVYWFLDSLFCFIQICVYLFISSHCLGYNWFFVSFQSDNVTLSVSFVLFKNCFGYSISPVHFHIVLKLDHQFPFFLKPDETWIGIGLKL